MKRVALIAAYNKGDNILLGKRRDNGKWTMPGGHLEEGETPLEGAKRELFEETGLKADSITELDEKRKMPNGLEIHTFKAVIGEGTPTSENDPDDECETWEWVDVSDGLPKRIVENCAGPPAWLAWKDGKANVLLDLHEMKKAQFEMLLAETLRKAIKSMPSEPLSKQEEDDEVDRMLMHPNPTERRMALKLGSVRDKHLIRGLEDNDQDVQRAAYGHPAMSANVLHALMRMPNRDHLQHAALSHPKIDLDHVKALYSHKYNSGNHTLIDAITRHPDLDGPFIDRMYSDGNGTRSLIANLRTPAETIQRILERHFLPGNGKIDAHRHLAMEALKHPHAPAHLVAKALNEGDEGIRIAAAGSRNLPASAADDVLKRGQLPTNNHEAYLRHALIASPYATANQLTQGLEDTHPRVRAGVFGTASPHLNASHVDRAIDKGDRLLMGLAMASPHAGDQHVQKMLGDKRAEVRQLGELFSQKRQAGLKKFGGELNEWLKTNDLQKAVKPDHFGGIMRASDPAGRELVDHKPHLEAHPPEQNHLVQAYREHILNSPQKVKKISAKKTEGITRKHLYQVPDTVQSVGGQKFMIKPYHERVIRRIQSWGKNPHQGWAEMAHQSLYHAAGIGDLHQKVHTSEHNMGEGFEHEPALVVAMDKDHRMVHDLGYAAALQADKTPVMKEQARKIAMMDFLTNNLDRHGGNLLMKWNYPERKAESLLAIDHSRSFQYHNTHDYKYEKEQEHPKEMEDRFGPYAMRSSIDQVAPLLDSGIPSLYDRQHKALEDYSPIFDWWGEVGPKVRASMDKQLEQIRDPEVRAHIKRNFEARADWLDERANIGIENYGTDWYKDSTPMYKRGQLTDEENRMKERLNGVTDPEERANLLRAYGMEGRF